MLKFWRGRRIQQLGISSGQIIIMNILFIFLIAGFLFSYLQEKENDVTLQRKDNIETFQTLKAKVADIESLWYEERIQPTPTGLRFIEQIDINIALESELITLPGIGPILAKRILDFREKKGSFKAIEDLTKVKGIGEQKFKKLKHYLKLK